MFNFERVVESDTFLSRNSESKIYVDGSKFHVELWPGSYFHVES